MGKRVHWTAFYICVDGKSGLTCGSRHKTMKNAAKCYARTGSHWFTEPIRKNTSLDYLNEAEKIIKLQVGESGEKE